MIHLKDAYSYYMNNFIKRLLIFCGSVFSLTVKTVSGHLGNGYFAYGHLANGHLAII